MKKTALDHENDFFNGMYDVTVNVPIRFGDEYSADELGSKLAQEFKLDGLLFHQYLNSDITKLTTRFFIPNNQTWFITNSKK